jgi:hypothetical protein
MLTHTLEFYNLISEVDLLIEELESYNELNSESILHYTDIMTIQERIEYVSDELISKKEYNIYDKETETFVDFNKKGREVADLFDNAIEPFGDTYGSLLEMRDRLENAKGKF